jgi:hypothetical protein
MELSIEPFEHSLVMNAIALLAREWVHEVGGEREPRRGTRARQLKSSWQSERFGIVGDVIGDGARHGRLGVLLGVVPQVPRAAERGSIQLDPQTPAARICLTANRNREKCPQKLASLRIRGVAEATVITTELGAEGALLGRDLVVRVGSVERGLQIAEIMQGAALCAGNLIHQLVELRSKPMHPASNL